MRRTLLVALATAPLTAGAQGSTEDIINRGIAAYRALRVEAARPLFRQIVSPSYFNPVTTQQRVTAYKYLGASYAVLGLADSAVTFFTAALLADPFTDLDPAEFSESELGPFNVAKSSVFRVGIQPVRPHVLNPRDSTTRYNFRYVTTHRANYRLELIQQSDTTIKETLVQGINDALNIFRWDGLLRSRGGVADSTTYFLRLTATSALPPPVGSSGPPTATESQFFRVDHSYEPLEDTLPPLPAEMRLPDRIAASAPWTDFLKAALVGGVAAGLGFAVVNNAPALGSDANMHLAAGSGVAVLSGLAHALWRRSHREIPGNVAENAQRERMRADFNARVNANNAEKRARTKLIITPLTGAQ